MKNVLAYQSYLLYCSQMAFRDILHMQLGASADYFSEATRGTFFLIALPFALRIPFCLLNARFFKSK